ncbi:transcriptional regulator, AraC family with amidase-like domain [Chitinophaga sp. YR627]|uniref:GlxA family transcriptional regulator n=1 Tax=Chitinophaga sp. YR627 TaxID=1881041 RepID=UPI0008EDE100|nr:DJ-1/PfpI family protein [Chitinophaga sp. YR627]SFM63363.1 transcriptional regulator, AraC family with amidase-like domain [Chitinophaga sp. YR627]
MEKRVIFFLLDHVHLMDLAGAVTVFYEAGCCGHPYELRYVSPYPSTGSSAGLGFTNVEPLEAVVVQPEDIVIVAGIDLSKWDHTADEQWLPWLQHAAAIGATVCSVCTAAFVLAVAGLLNGRDCTTHWGYTKALAKHFPRANVIENKLFVKSDNIYTSAGISTGIDLALYLVEADHGPAFAYTVAKDMVVYIRRDGDASQHSIYLQHRQHISYQVHQVQDHITRQLHTKLTITELAEQAHMSPRNLTRLFKTTTGITIGDYIRHLREEKAVQLLKEGHKLAWVGKVCGIGSSRQLSQLARKGEVKAKMA